MEYDIKITNIWKKKLAKDKCVLFTIVYNLFTFYQHSLRTVNAINFVPHKQICKLNTGFVIVIKYKYSNYNPNNFD